MKQTAYLTIGNESLEWRLSKFDCSWGEVLYDFKTSDINKAKEIMQNERLGDMYNIMIHGVNCK